MVRSRVNLRIHEVRRRINTSISEKYDITTSGGQAESVSVSIKSVKSMIAALLMTAIERGGSGKSLTAEEKVMMARMKVKVVLMMPIG
jgi:hypothetical protein